MSDRPGTRKAQKASILQQQAYFKRTDYLWLSTCEPESFARKSQHDTAYMHLHAAVSPESQFHGTSSYTAKRHESTFANVRTAIDMPT